ncbi:MAG: UbiA family prenyltransferase [Ferruginibacter sp.]
MKWLQFILSHSIFISLCAVALCVQSFILLHLPVLPVLCAFVFFATLASYNFYWLAGKFAFSRKKNISGFLKVNVSYLAILLLSGITLLFLLPQLPQAWLLVVVAGICTILYSMPLWNPLAARVARRTGFLKTILLSFTWALVTAWLPAYAGGYPSGGYALLLLLFTARFFFMLMLCLIFDMRDIHVDKLHALHSLATDLGRADLQRIMVISFLLYMLAGFSLRFIQEDNLQLVAHVFTGVITWVVYRLSRKKREYVFYYFLVDGLMLISAFGTILAAI